MNLLASLAANLLDALQAGMTLFLIASGLTLILGVMRFINLAHASFYTLGGYLTVQLTAWTHSFVLAIVGGTVLVALLANVLERSILRRLYDRGHLDQVLATFGLVLIGNAVVRWLWGDAPLAAPLPPYLAGSMVLGALTYPANRVAVIFASFALAVALHLFMQRTVLGATLRAAASDPEATEAMGIDVARVKRLSFCIGAGLAATAGSLTSSLTQVYPSMGTDVLVSSFLVVVVGGLGSLRGAWAGALTLGAISTWGQVLAPRVAGPLVYLLMALLLVFRPQGLFSASHG